MTLFAYNASRELEQRDEPFYGLIMAAMRRADSFNLRKLQDAFPDVWFELETRYNAPRALLPGEHDEEGYRRDEQGVLYGPKGEVLR